MPAQHGVDVDGGRNVGLHEIADDRGLAVAEIVDSSEIRLADAVHDRAERRIACDAAPEHGPAVDVDHLAQKLDIGMDIMI